MRQSAEAATLPAASLILASISLLWTAWYREMREAVDERRPNAVDEKTAWEARRELQRKARALPIAAALAAFLAVFTPDVLTVLFDAADRVLDPDRWDDYQATGAALVLIWLFAAGMLVHVWRLYRALSPSPRRKATADRDRPD